MRFWFQNLKKEDREKRLFHFRGSIGPDWNKTWLSYSAWSGPALKFEYQHGQAGDNDYSSNIKLGLGFFTLSLTFFLPKKWYFLQKCTATWDGGRTFYLVQGRNYGFYFYQWAFVWSWHSKVHESSSRDPWWMHQYIHIDELFLGRVETLKDSLVSIENVKFRLGDNEFTMNSIEWVRYRKFRRFIPYSIYHKTFTCVDMKIDKPPMFQGKGENSWDCGDDGIFGSHQMWPFDQPNYKNREEMAELAVDLYVESVFKNVKRYGGTSGERGVTKGSEYEYLGHEPDFIENPQETKAP